MPQTPGMETPDPERPPRGLVFFPPGASPRHRRRRLVFVLVQLGVALMLVWPVYPRFAGIEPFILGLPLSFAWVILALLVGFVALLWLYLGEEDRASQARPTEGGG